MALRDLQSTVVPRPFAYLVCLAASIGPGTLFLFTFRRPLFLQMQTPKLILLAAAITLPFIAASFASLEPLLAPRDAARADAGLPVPLLLTCACLVAIAVFAVAVLCGQYFRISVSAAVALLVLLEAVVSAASFTAGKLLR